LGKKGEYDILALTPRRAAFLSDPTDKIVFHYNPNHRSWMKQIEIWLSILVSRLLKCGSFTSVEALEANVFAGIESYNRTMTKPFKWTFQGKALII
jgi:putative transposase